jgi:glycosyltransferase involved in cell wall biosynthesis
MIEKLNKNIWNSTRFNLIIAGFTDDKESLMQLIQNYNNIEFKGALPQADVLSLIQSSCDYGIAFYNMSSLNNKYCAPLKIHEYFMFNKLVISFKNPPLVEIENNFGIIYTINNIDEILSDLEFLKIEKRLLNIRNNSFEIFRQEQNDKFNSEMNNIIKLFNSDQVTN